LIRSHGIRSDVSVVVHGRERPFGVLGVHALRPRGFDDDDIAVLQAVANVFAAAVERVESDRTLRRSEAAREQMLEAMLRGQEQERARLAADLHDDTIQVMAATLLGLDRLDRAIQRHDLARAGEAAKAARASLEAALERTRLLIFEVRPPLLEARGVGAAVHDLAAELQRDAGLDVTVEADEHRYAFYLEDLTYRTVREAVANARKHAQARRVVISLSERGGVLHGYVCDDGVGFDVLRTLDVTERRFHTGLGDMMQRVRLANGQVGIDSHPGGGTRVDFQIPLPPRSLEDDGDAGWLDDVTARRAARHAINEARLRELNKRLADHDTDAGLADHDLTFVCECFRAECGRHVAVTAREWEQIHADPVTYVVWPGHEDVPQREAVIARTDRYWVVKKIHAAEKASRDAVHEVDQRAHAGGV
jgi:signal transduction histidine kinase